MKKPALPSNVAKRWFEVWYANPRDNSRAARIDARRRSEKRAREIAQEFMDKGLAHKPNGAWIVEVNRLKRSPVEKGTSYVNGHCLGPAERDPATGNIEQGPHITRRHAANGDIAVVAIDQSPMNAKRWSLTLSCGHEVWVTSARRPKAKTSKCEKCAAT